MESTLMRHVFAASVIGAIFAGTGLAAQDRGIQDWGTVVELYTSQGCSSCPPADRIFEQIADRDDVIALALHVDYWDYIGWKDDLGSPAFTARQRGYAREWQARNVYTPQMVVAGVKELVGSHPVKAMDAIASHPAQNNPVQMSLSRTGDVATVNATAVGAVPPRALVQIVRYTPRVTRDIQKGENAGKTVIYRNVVTSWVEAGEWNTGQPLSLNVNVTGDAPVVAIIQDGAAGAILGAVQLR
ncbi:DUF1223 domain-containing protein [Loktanella salsilacus]|uniref:DUF1223 domain-containing protein n=1 Tax=Loktanella salsilacus TaxID=195913 RepID=UPI003734DE4A